MKSHLTTPNNNGDQNVELNKSANNLMNVSGLLDISGLSAFIPDEHANRMSMGAPSDLGQSLIPYLSPEQKAVEVQCDLWSVAEMAQQKERIKLLSEQLEERNQVIDELERKHEAALKSSKESEKVRKLKYDN